MVAVVDVIQRFCSITFTRRYMWYMRCARNKIRHGTTIPTTPLVIEPACPENNSTQFISSYIYPINLFHAEKME
jgi:hypothetical protein